MSMIVVAHVAYNLKIGGLERVVVNLVRGSIDSPYRCVVVCLEQEGELADEIKALGVPLFNMSKKDGWDWNCIFRLARRFHKEGVQIVHTHNIAAHFHGGIAALLAGVPVRVHTKHGRDYPDIKKRVLLNRVLSWFTHAIVPVSDNARDVALEIEKVNPSKIHRIWNGVDTEQYRPEPTTHKQPTIGTVARLSPEKDQKTMLAAFRLVLDELPDARLVFAGDGESAAELRETAAKLALTGHVDFLGMRTDIREVLNTFDLFTLSSITEGISMTILEAMACGLPVVATDVGGNKEIIHPPECGLTAPARDPRALAEAYLTLLRDPARRAAMGTAARERAMQHFSVETMVKAYSTLYEQLLEENLVAA